MSQQRIQRCSYCRREGHKINGCNDITIESFMSGLRIKYNSAMIHETGNLLNVYDYIDRLRDTAKAAAVSKANSRLSDSYATKVNNLITFVSAEWQERQNNITRRRRELFQEERRRQRSTVGGLRLPVPPPSRQYNLDRRATIYNINELGVTNLSWEDLPRPARLFSHLYDIEVSHVSQESNNRTWEIKSIFTSKNTSKEGEEECPICYEENIEPKNILETNCCHSFCKNCICHHVDSFKSYKIPTCPLCRTNITSFTVNDECNFVELDKKYKKKETTNQDYESSTPNLVVYIDDFEISTPNSVIYID
jgi:hypothetical protein